MNFLLAITVGPVQDFIATARRSRDLWFGSWLLSELAKAIANEIVMRCKKENLIFPATDDPGELLPDTDFNVANKILALVDDPATIARAAHDAALKRLEEIRAKAYAKFSGSSFFYENNAVAQVNDMVEFFWAAYPYSENEYDQSRDRVELLLNARKATRDFKPSAAWASNAPKSALDGQRESVIHEDAFHDLPGKELRQLYGVRAGERLCGVGLLKRNGTREGKNKDSFFSTSHVAALPLLERLKPQHASALAAYVNKLCSALNLHPAAPELGRVPSADPYRAHDVFSRPVNGRKIGFDGHILFAERLDDLLEDQQTASGDLKEAKKAVRGFLLAAFDEERPLPYYALLLADGDNMGQAIDDIKEIKRHRDFSKKLSAFARSVSAIVVNKHKGSLVYAGGDDALAFLPLHTVLPCARELADAFKTQLDKSEFGIEKQPTLSVGVVIAHHLESLQDALSLVRSAERAAKKVPGKNALAITLSKRGGVDRTIKGSWDSVDGCEPFDRRLLKFAQLHKNGDLPDGAAYELRDLHLRLHCSEREHESDYATLQAAMRAEAGRILGRKKGSEVLEELKDDIKSEKTSVADLAQELIVARIFAEALRQAEGKGQQA